MTAPASLLSPGDPPPFTVHNPDGRARVLLVCDHAGRAIPRLLSQLGLADWVLDRHVAWDIGAAQVAVALADRLDAPLVMANYSRLVIDPNRGVDEETSCREVSDGIAIPGNQGLSATDRARRAASCRSPYHAEIAARLEALTGRGLTPAMVAVHTCTPVFDEVVRPWQVGVMWDEDPRIAVPLIAALRRQNVSVGDNEPYSGRDPDDYTLDHHAEGNGLPYAGIEVRQDLVNTDAGATHWAGVLADALAPILDDDTLYQRWAASA